jgi:amino acid adenylation domain-containing protein
VSSLVELMAELRCARVRVWAEGDQLRYQAPRGALTPELLGELRNRKAEIVELVRQAHDGCDMLPLSPVPRQGALSISLAQHRLWLLDQIEGASATYNIPQALRLEGDLDVDALRRSFAAILRRHESLRTSFHAEGDSARPLIAAQCPLPWRIVDLRHLPAEHRMAEIRRQAREEALHSFDLSHAPLIRFVLWQSDARDHVVMMTVHHIVADGRSIEILAAELSTFYQAHIAGKNADLPPLRVQYADFAWHQRRWLTEAALQPQLAYWRRQLADLPPLLQIPTDRPRPSVFSSAGATVRSELAGELVSRTKQLARQSGTTPYVVLLAAAATLLARYTGRQDIPIACPATHRTRPELDSIIGFFVNTLALRFDLSGNPSFRELLQRARAIVTDALANQDIPFEKVVETLRSEPNPSYPPLVQFSMVMLDAVNARPSLPGIQAAPFDFGNPIARFDISLEMYESERGLDIFWIHSTSLFEPETIARMARHLQSLLDAATADPDRPVFELDLLDAAERQQLLRQFNGTERPYPRDATVDELFERQAEATPDSVAIEFGEQQLTYRELNRRANQLAARLRSLGAGADTVVALSLERSLELPVAMLGVLKAGAAFLPLDPKERLARLDHVLNEVQPVVILSQQHLADGLPVSFTYVLCLDAEWDDIAGECAENLPRQTTAEHLAYIMYTSGSTGRPKGVCVPHRGIVRLVKEIEYVSLSAQETILQLAPVTFDASTFEIWGALLNGGRLVIMPPEMPSPEDLGQTLRRHGVTTLWLSAGLFHLMADERLEDLLTLRQLLCGGDVLSPDHVRRVLQAAGGRLTLINGYGPTETTTFAVCHAMTRPDQAGTRVPIGRPIANTRAYVLDQNGNPVPIGVEGDLFIGGDGLARGYLNAAGMTAERFVADPFDARPGRRMYRTGDRARWLSDGTLEFLGRLDQQVKIRGFRVELGEIEAALCEHSAVRRAVVLAVQDGLEKRLTAYVTPAAGAPTLSEVRHFLHSRLPDYMRTDALLALDDLPLTVNGKVDRDALRRLDADPERSTVYEPPEGDIEAQLAKIWAAILVVDRVGRHEKFFQLGGHSLLAAQIIARVQDAFGVMLPIRILFDGGTVASMARALGEFPQVARAAEVARLRAEIDQMDPAQIQQLLKQKSAAAATPMAPAAVPSIRHGTSNE